MARRGDRLREHILWTAKDVFLEVGFERTSMDVLAARAETSKRTLYAHFENKDALFLAVVDFVRGLHLNRLGTPEDYGDDRLDAVTGYCVGFLWSVVWVQSVRTCRLVIAEAERVPAAAADFYDAIFATTRRNLAAFVAAAWRMPESEALAAVDDIFSLAIHPRFTAVLFGIEDAPGEWPERPPATTDPDYERIRRIVVGVLGDA